MALLQPEAQLGRYTILAKLARGGMSEVYLARQLGPGDFTKVLALKVIHPHLADEPGFVQMFRNEAKLAAMLNHPNIVQIFDFGVMGQVHYMAMEYIDGQHLGRIVRVFDQMNQRIPMAQVLRIVSDACGALDFAHSLADAEGTPLGLVHRDISVENILLTYTGQVKLVDFGIAKVRTLESVSSTGVLKGKAYYMPPELLRGEALDQQGDVFATGVVLYRMLTGRMPFDGKHHAQIFEQILHGEIEPPQALVPDMPAGLAETVMRALARDRQTRYPSARALQVDLEQAISEAGSAVTAHHLSQLMTAAFPPGFDRHRAVYLSVTGLTPKTPTNETDLYAHARRTGVPLPEAKDSPTENTRSTTRIEPPEVFGGGPATTDSMLMPSPRPRRWLSWTFTAAVVAIAFALLLWGRFSGAPAERERPPAGDLARSATPANEAPRAARAAAELDATDAPDASAIDRASTIDASIADVDRMPAGYLTLRGLAPAEVFVDGRQVGQLPLDRVPLQAGTHQLLLRSKRHRYEVSRKVDVGVGRHRRLTIAPRKGSLRILVRPWAQVAVDGEDLGLSPVAPVELWEGPHLLVLSNDQLGVTRRRRVRVLAGRQQVIKVFMNRAR